MRRFFQWVVLLAVVGFAQTATAQSADVEKKVDALLGGIEYVPTAQEWTTLGPEAAGVLRAIAGNDAERPSRRARALSALAYFPSADTRTFLEATAKDATAKTVYRRKSLRALAFAYRADALVFVSGYAASEDKHLRDAAAKSLADIGTPEARVVLEGRLQVEKAKFVRETIEQSLAR